jgi:hypothetical protein
MIVKIKKRQVRETSGLEDCGRSYEDVLHLISPVIVEADRGARHNGKHLTAL